MSDAPRKPGSRERVRAILGGLGLAEALFEFEKGSTKTAQQAADAMGCELGQIVKSLVLVVDESPVLALVAGDRRGDLAAIAAEMGGGSARMANADEVRHATGYAIGGVCPFGLPSELPVLIDDSLERFEVVYPAAGTPESMVKMERLALFALVDGRVARVSLG